MSMDMTKKMKGFMCHSPSSTSVCMSQDRRSMIVDQIRLVKSTKYVRLGEHRALSTKRSFPVSNQEKKDATSLPSVPADAVFQVVVMRVSIHCQGCAGKVRKHLSRMEGVTSFSVDLETKRVTVRGHVSASGVVESVSKVKKAELLWPC